MLMMTLQIRNSKNLFEMEKMQRSQKWSTIFHWNEIHSLKEKDFGEMRSYSNLRNYS